MESSTLDLIQHLSDERQEIWRLKRLKRLPKLERLQYLNRRIAELWNERRCELAGQHQPFEPAAAPAPTPDNSPRRSTWWNKQSVWLWDGPEYARSSTEAISMTNIRCEVGYRSPVSDAQLAEALNLDNLGTTIIREVLLDLKRADADRKGREPLRNILNRRNEHMVWVDMARGRQQGYATPLHT